MYTCIIKAMKEELIRIFFFQMFYCQAVKIYLNFMLYSSLYYLITNHSVFTYCFNYRIIDRFFLFDYTIFLLTFCYPSSFSWYVNIEPSFIIKNNIYFLAASAYIIKSKIVSIFDIILIVCSKFYLTFYFSIQICFFFHCNSKIFYIKRAFSVFVSFATFDFI